MSHIIVNHIEITESGTVIIASEHAGCWPRRWMPKPNAYLTKAYAAGGQQGLDCALLDRLLCVAAIGVGDATMQPYRHALGSKASARVFEGYGLKPGPDGKYGMYTPGIREIREDNPERYKSLLKDLSLLCAESRERQKRRRRRAA